MLNQIVMVGRLVGEPEVKELEDGKEVSNITLAVPRSYKNAEGEYETDFVDCTLWNGVARNACEYLKKGDLVGIKGRVETKVVETDGESRKYTTVVAEKLTFLSSRKNEIDEELEQQR